MRPSDLSFRGQETLPQWAATLARQMSSGGAGAAADLLSPVPLLEELVAIVDGMTRGHSAPQRADRQSLRNDLMLACDKLGPATAALHATTLKSFRAQAGQLEQGLETVPGAVALAPITNVLLAELASPESREAAFDDCVAAFEGLASADECELRLRQLRSFMVRAGHDWTERAKLVLDALADRLNAQIAAGAERPTDPSVWIRPVGMTLDTRLTLAKRLLSAEPPRGDVIVWLAYATATIDRFYLSKGPLEFYDWRIWPAALDGQWIGNPDWQQPAELADPDAANHFGGLPGEDFVMVRVALTDIPSPEAESKARELVEAALALTGWEAEWIALRGAAAYTTYWFGTLGFVDPRTVPPWSNPLLDPVTSELAGVDGDLLERFRVGDQAAKELVDDVRWRRDASRALSRDHRVALAVTLIERILPPTSPAGTAWYDVTSYYLKTLLALDDVSLRVRDAGEMSVHTRISADRHEPFVHANEIVEHRGLNAFAVHADRVVARIDELLAYAEPGTMEARMLAEVKACVVDGPTALAWLVECEVRFERLLARARRQRNAITHGTRTVAEVVSSIEPFLDRIAGRLVGALQASVEQKTYLPTQLAGYRTWWDKRKAALAAGGDPGAELFPPG